MQSATRVLWGAEKIPHYDNDRDFSEEDSHDSGSDYDEDEDSDDEIEETSTRRRIYDEKAEGISTRQYIWDEEAEGSYESRYDPDEDDDYDDEAEGISTREFDYDEKGKGISTRSYTRASRKAPRSKSVRIAISDDGSRGSEFDRNFGGSSQQREGSLHQRPAQQQFRYERVEQRLRQTEIQRPTFASYAKQADPLANALESVSRVLNIQGKYPALTIDTLQAYLLDLNSKKEAQTPPVPVVQLVHRVFDRSRTKGPRSEHLYLDQPAWSEGETFLTVTFEGCLPLRNVSSHLSNHPEICCLIYRDYDITSLTRRDSSDEDLDTRVDPDIIEEFIEPVTESLTSAITRFLDYYKFNTANGVEVNSTKLVAPYAMIYHARQDNLTSFVETLEENQRIQFRVMMNYILSQYENEYRLVNEMIGKGRITQEYIEYLFKPGEIIVLGRDQEARGCCCKTWLSKTQIDSKSVYWKNVNRDNLKSTFDLETWSWDFDGEFSKKESLIFMDFAAKDYSEKNICDLSIRPLRFVDGPTETRLKTRGQWFWKCRERRMISYDGGPEGWRHSSDERYMVDMMMYRYEYRSESSTIKRAGAGYLPFSSMTQENPPDEAFIYLAPLKIKAYSLKRKRWCDLKLDGLREVSWDTKAFEGLVLKEKTKRLIHALVGNQIEAEKSTDLISGKGNGLIMLLHGGPGTGKTLTAQSVAEIAKKPLYPVTCGDIGTKPDEVEDYLEYVLHLGKTWGCVVLLDEADVFLEQRSLDDLHRNALVSVFLQVLERFNGILILTSSRVGTFDEAFKSRIQLAVHYGTLTAPQRTTIWKNFIGRLRELNEEGIDFDDLNNKISQLASKEMNGREIRNAITTARQYARWERQQDRSFKLNYNVVKEVIETAGEFDKYINTLNNGLTQEELAKQEGIR